MYFLKFITILNLSLLAVSALAATDTPNVILLLSDDAGYADFGFQGDHRYVTPNLDQIAKNGVKFSNAYVTASVCAPSRAGLLTGRYQNRFGFEFNLYGMKQSSLPVEKRGLALSESTLADLMQDAGYATGIIGKWGLGQHPLLHPQERGFKEFFGILGDKSAYSPGKALQVVSNYKSVNPKSLSYLTDTFGDEAVEFIERHQDEPFFLYLSFTAPHAPLQGRSDYLKHYKNIFKTKRRAVNASMTQSMDENIGKVIAKLKHLGLYENTIIIFTNDNGGALNKNGSSNAPLRGGKGTVFEGGVRSPFLIQWPSTLSKNQIIDFPISTLDILPTIVSATGGELASDKIYDGVNLIPYLKGEIQKKPHDALFWRVNWAAAVRKENWKLIRTPQNKYLLFDLLKDSSEATNLSSSKPAIVSSLKKDLDAWEKTLAPPLWVPHSMWKNRVSQKYEQAQ
ncbi:MAG: hypothetical protein BMS9Abin25_0253 [Gammaproteobacteria bacterium]|nr:MAG: hypothetical protein BMS9Abin25_0253 [Gammaproteobacteria bacterium]